MAIKKRIWEGSVGIVIEPQRKGDGTHFWNYTLTRAYKKDGDESFSYSSNFSDRNDDALKIVLEKAKAFRAENSADEWVQLEGRIEARGVIENSENTESQSNQPAA